MPATPNTLSISLPREAIPLLLMQRSQYRPAVIHRAQKILLFPLPKAAKRHVVRKFFLPLESAVHHRQIERLYYQDMAAVFETFRSHLKPSAIKVLDIGAGMAGIDCIISQAHGPDTEIWLLDKVGESDAWNAGFHKNVASFSYYNSFDMAQKVLEGAGVTAERIKTIDIDRQPYPVEQKFDLICSFLSYGFHYPVSTYAEDIRRSLAPDGRVVLDIRKGTISAADISAAFGLPAKVVYEEDKLSRYVIGKGVA
ncbi:MAG: hypothetical protein U1E15_09220 [Hyphomicrobiales bacterium]